MHFHGWGSELWQWKHGPRQVCPLLGTRATWLLTRLLSLWPVGLCGNVAFVSTVPLGVQGTNTVAVLLDPMAGGSTRADPQVALAEPTYLPHSQTPGTLGSIWTARPAVGRAQACDLPRGSSLIQGPPTPLTRSLKGTLEVLFPRASAGGGRVVTNLCLTPGRAGPAVFAALLLGGLAYAGPSKMCGMASECWQRLGDKRTGPERCPVGPPPRSASAALGTSTAGLPCPLTWLPWASRGGH